MVIGLVTGLVVARGPEQQLILGAIFLMSTPAALLAGGMAREIDCLVGTKQQAQARWETERDAEALARLHRLAEVLKDLFGSAHDASSPILATQLVLDWLERGDGDRDVSEARFEVTSETWRSISNERSRSTRQRPQPPVPCASTKIVQDLVKVKGTLARIEPCLAKVHDGDASFRRLAANLIDNAHEAARSTVRVTCVPASDDAAELVVEDDGSGFGPDFQIGAFNSSKASGVGLGLFIAGTLGGASLGLESDEPHTWWTLEGRDRYAPLVSVVAELFDRVRAHEGGLAVLGEQCRPGDISAFTQETGAAAPLWEPDAKTRELLDRVHATRLQ